MDFSNVKSLSIPEGEVSKIQFLPNLVGSSIDTDGSIYNGCGYMDGYRLSSSGAVKEYNDIYFQSTVTGFIPVADGDVLHIEGCYWLNLDNALNYICGYDAEFNCIGAEYSQNVNNGICYGTKFIDHVTGDRRRARAVLMDNADLAYIRVSCVTPLVGQTISGAHVLVATRSSAQTVWSKYSYTNQVLISIDTDGTVYNETGYKGGYRLSSSGVEKADNYHTVFGYIPVKGGDTIRFCGQENNGNDIIWANGATSTNYICVYKSDFTLLYAGNATSEYSTTKFVESMTNDGVVSTIKLKNVADIAYFRMCVYGTYSTTGIDGTTAIITVNEEITD
jgi:hypothetical protein